MTHAHGSSSSLCPCCSSHGCSGPMAGATTPVLWGHPLLLHPQDPTYPAGLLRERVWLLGTPSSASPVPSSTCTRGRLLLRAPPQPCPRLAAGPARSRSPCPLPIARGSWSSRSGRRSAPTPRKQTRVENHSAARLWVRALPGWQKAGFLAIGS